jgi:hypothetical protein
LTSNIKKMYWLLGRKSQLSVHNKLLLYKQVVKPIWTYGIQLWGCAATSNINKIRVQGTARYCDAPWYYRKDHVHRDLKLPTIRQELQRFAERYERRLHSHVNTEVLQLLDQCFPTWGPRTPGGPRVSQRGSAG